MFREIPQKNIVSHITNRQNIKKMPKGIRDWTRGGHPHIVGICITEIYIQYNIYT